MVVDTVERGVYAGTGMRPERTTGVVSMFSFSCSLALDAEGLSRVETRPLARRDSTEDETRLCFGGGMGVTDDERANAEPFLAGVEMAGAREMRPLEAEGAKELLAELTTEPLGRTLRASDDLVVEAGSLLRSLVVLLASDNAEGGRTAEGVEKTPEAEDSRRSGAFEAGVLPADVRVPSLRFSCPEN